MTYEITPARQAFLDTIAFAEGADYNVMFTGRTFSGYGDHPRQLQTGGGFTSDAAGRYQFLSTTWDGLGLPDFSPANQDQGALALLEQRGALAMIDAGNIRGAIEAVSWEWASFPPGRYGQPVKNMEEMLAYYNDRAAEYGANGVPAAGTVGSSGDDTIAGGESSTQARTVQSVMSQLPDIEEDPYLDKCPHLLFRGIITDYGRSTDARGESTLVVSGEGFGKIYNDSQVLADLQSPVSQGQSMEVRLLTQQPQGVVDIYYALLGNWVAFFWGEETGWQPRTRPIPVTPNYVTRINNEGGVWANLKYLSIEGFFTMFVDHTGAIVWEKNPFSSRDRSLISGRDWEDLPIAHCPSWKILSYQDRLTERGITNFLRCVPTMQGVGGGGDPASMPALVYNVGAIRQYGGVRKRELFLPIGTDDNQWYTSHDRREQQASNNSFADLCALEAIGWYDRPVQRVSLQTRGESGWRIGTRISIEENWHDPSIKPGEYYIVARSHSIDIPSGTWTSSLECTRDRRQRYLGIGVGDELTLSSIPQFEELFKGEMGFHRDITLSNTFNLPDTAGFDALNAPSFSVEDGITPEGEIEPTKEIEAQEEVVEDIESSDIPAVFATLEPDDYRFFDRLQGKIIEIGNDAIAYADAQVVPNLGESGAQLRVDETEVSGGEGDDTIAASEGENVIENIGRVPNPVPGSDYSNNGGYDADSGLDISVPEGTPCVTPFAGTVVYAEEGHTTWMEDAWQDTPGYQVPHSVSIRLDAPFEADGVTVNFVWFTHLGKVDSSILNKGTDKGIPVHVNPGHPIGLTGTANNSPHLHIGFVQERAQHNFVRHQVIAEMIWGPRG